jgi:hypothetical protein
MGHPSPRLIQATTPKTVARHHPHPHLVPTLHLRLHLALQAQEMGTQARRAVQIPLHRIMVLPNMRTVTGPILVRALRPRRRPVLPSLKMGTWASLTMYTRASLLPVGRPAQLLQPPPLLQHLPLFRLPPLRT